MVGCIHNINLEGIPSIVHPFRLNRLLQVVRKAIHEPSGWILGYDDLQLIANVATHAQ